MITFEIFKIKIVLISEFKTRKWNITLFMAKMIAVVIDGRKMSAKSKITTLVNANKILDKEIIF